MNNQFYFKRHFFFLLGSLFFFCACSISPPTLSHEPAVQDAQALMRLPGQFSSMKAMGNLSFVQNGVLFHARIGLAAEYPSKIRMEIILPIGVPLYTIATDGAYLYVHEHFNNEYYVAAATDRILNRAVGMPISPSDLICLLFGRIPLREIVSATYVEVPKSSSDSVQTLLSVTSPSNQRYEVFLKNTNQPMQLNFYDRKTCYLQSFLSNWKNTNDIWLPRHLKWVDSKGQAIEISIENVWFGEIFSPELFQIIKPADEKKEGVN